MRIVLHKSNPYLAGLSIGQYSLMGLMLKTPDDEVMTGRELTWGVRQKKYDPSNINWSRKYQWPPGTESVHGQEPLVQEDSETEQK